MEQSPKIDEVIDAFEDAVRDLECARHNDAEFTRDDERKIRETYTKAREALVEFFSQR